ncbi:MAG: acyl transferase [Crocinitomicaceae bacterium]
MNVQEVEKLPFDLKRIFSIHSEEEFIHLSLQVFHFQYANNPVYKKFVDLIGVPPSEVKTVEQIPFLPISFFKTHTVKSTNTLTEKVFYSSGTTGQTRSKHHIADLSLYELSFLKGFEHFYGHLENYLILGLLPAYHENEHSSLIYMVDHLMQWTKYKESSFLLNDYERLLSLVERYKGNRKILLIGVSYALLDLSEKYKVDLSDCIVMETGGMKGRRTELTKETLHQELKEGFGLDQIHSEYGMTELLSQAYSKEDQLFFTPPWMKVLIRQHNDPFQMIEHKSGGINVIDLANIYSCSFIATQDLGKTHSGGFEVLGRFDHSDIRGCNLLIQ